MSPTDKKVATTDPVLLAFEQADQAPPLSDEDRDALVEAAADPRWVRMGRGEAFERLVCERGEGDDNE
jgi:hypothetical protein